MRLCKKKKKKRMGMTDDAGEPVLQKLLVDLFFILRIVFVNLNNLSLRHLPALNLRERGELQINMSSYSLSSAPFFSRRFPPFGVLKVSGIRQ